jgi:hypothetical protein
MIVSSAAAASAAAAAAAAASFGLVASSSLMLARTLKELASLVGSLTARKESGIRPKRKKKKQNQLSRRGPHVFR